MPVSTIKVMSKNNIGHEPDEEMEGKSSIGTEFLPPTELTVRIKRPKNLALPAFVITILFNHVCGFFAFYFNFSARDSWEQKDFEKSKRHQRYAMTLLIVGLLLGIATYVLAFTIYFVVLPGNSSSISGNSSTFGNQKVYATNCCLQSSFYESYYEGDAQPLFCETMGDNPLYADPNGNYQDCCSLFGCFPQT